MPKVAKMCLNYGIEHFKGTNLFKKDTYINSKSQTGQYLKLFALIAVAYLFFGSSGAFASGVFDQLVDRIRDQFLGQSGGGPRTSGVRHLFGVICYLLGLVCAISGILKFKDHVDSPPNHPLKSAVARLFIGGAFLSMPTIIDAMVDTIGLVSPGSEAYAETPVIAGGLGNIVENIRGSFKSPARLFSMISYLFGVAFGIWSLAEFIRTADSPAQNPVRRPIMILLTGSALLTMPTIISALISTFDVFALIAMPSSGMEGAPGSSLALDQILVRVVTDLHRPLIYMAGHAATIGGLAFAMIGVFRLMKSAQDGPKAPWGSGTIGTFLAAGALLSIANFMGGVEISIFGKAGELSTYAVLANSEGMDPLVVNRANQAIQAVFMFVQIVGYISFVRGVFILRSFGEGDQQASMSAGLTHIFGGAVAANLTALIGAVQTTLGLVGLTFAS